MDIVEMKITDIIPYENNPRRNEEAVDKVALSISSFGFKVPIIVDKNNVIVAGHTRLKAAEKLGLTTVPTIRADDLTDDQIKAFRLADNKVSEFAEWDFEALEKELDSIEMDMSLFGFEDESEDEMSEVVEDDFNEEPPADTQIKVGDIFQLGEHRLMCGDSTDPDAVATLMGGVKAKLLLTDPPYGISVVSGGAQSELATGRVGGVDRSTSGRVGGGSMNTPKNNRISPDAVVPAKVYKQIIGDETTETAKKCYEVAKEFSENQIIFGGNYFTDFLTPSRCWIVWDKENTGNFADAELAWTSFDKGVKLYRFMWNGLAREGSRKVEGITRVHPTQKPVGMLGNILNDFSDEGDAVLDCFGGSGSTLIACEQLNRTCYMMELDPHYVEVIIQRWESFTGQKAVKLS